MPDRAIFSGGIHALEDQQNGITIGRIKKLLQRAQFCNVLGQQLEIVFCRLIRRFNLRRPLAQIHVSGLGHTKVTGFYFHLPGSSFDGKRSLEATVAAMGRVLDPFLADVYTGRAM
jgi:hypothetical protein